MKVCIYMEWKNYIRTGGVRTAYRNRIKACRYAGIEVTNNPKGDFDILQLEFPGIRSLYYIKRIKRRGKKSIISTHITAEDFKETFFFGRKTHYLLKRYLQFFYSKGDALLSPSEYTRNLLLSYGIKRPIYVISNGIDPEFIKSASIKEDLSDKPIIGCVGFVTERKGVRTFAHLAKKFPECKFVWVGDIKRGLLFDIEKLGNIPNLVFTGYVEDVKSWYRRFDIFLFPSYEENEGIVLFEAGSFGLPLIVRDIPAYEGWLFDGLNCLKCKDEKDFEENIKKVLNDDLLRKKLKINSRRLAEDHSLEVIGKKLRHIYQSVLDSSM